MPRTVETSAPAPTTLEDLTSELSSTRGERDGLRTDVDWLLRYATYLEEALLHAWRGRGAPGTGPTEIQYARDRAGMSDDELVEQGLPAHPTGGRHG